MHENFLSHGAMQKLEQGWLLAHSLGRKELKLSLGVYSYFVSAATQVWGTLPRL